MQPMEKPRNKFRKPILNMVLLPAALMVLCSCALVDNSPVSNLDKNFEAAVQNTKDKGYPDLTKIPPVPTNLKTDKQWSELSATMDKKLLIVTNNPNSDMEHPNTPDENWGQSKLDKMNNNPQTNPAPQEDLNAWAARLRAMTNSPTK